MIGIFDSGIGGLTVLKALKEKSPQTDVVYFGDIKNAPYGIKTQDDLKILTALGVKKLLENGATNILSACNSVSAFMVLEEIGLLSDVPFGIVEMINPTVSEFKNHSGEILIFATPATIESGAYQENFRKHNVEIKTFPIAELAGAIEFGADENEIERIIDEATTGVSQDNFDKVILCCTHYPFFLDKFEQSFKKIGRKVEIFDPASVVAETALSKFNNNVGDGELKFIISQDTPNFRKMVEKHFANYNYTIEVI